MPAQPRHEKTPPDPAKSVGCSGSTDDSDAKSAEEPATKPLTPEEQLARFEEALKEEDWGHQPC